MKNLSALDWICLVLVIVGALNWGLYGLFRLDLVALIFGQLTFLSRLIYILVGLSAVYLIYLSTKFSRK